MRIAIVFVFGLAGMVAAVLFCDPLRTQLETVVLGQKGVDGAQTLLKPVEPHPRWGGEQAAPSAAADEQHLAPASAPSVAAEHEEGNSQPVPGEAADSATPDTANDAS